MSTSDKVNRNIPEPAITQSTERRETEGWENDVAASGIPETALPASGRPQPDPAVSSLDEHVTEPTYTDTDVDPTDADTVMRSGERAPGSPVPEHIERAIDNAAGKAAAEVAAYAREIGSQVAGSDATATQRAPVTAAGRAREAQGSKWATSEDPGDKVFVRDTAGDVEDTTADLRDPAATQQRPPEDVVPDVRDRVTPRLT